MFKFLKSKKGFTLVELMIVVVIMAILVAVAVPIYSAVTKNARIKTCKGNQREIVAQITNSVMGDTSILATGLSTKDGPLTKTIDITTDEDGNPNYTLTDDQVTAVFKDKATFVGMFQAANFPVCPVDGAKLTITCEWAKGADLSSVKVSVSCDQDGHSPAAANTGTEENT